MVKILWDILLPFSDYAFNRAHSAAYGVVSYWTAYLKANYPAEYMAAVLTSVRDDKDKAAVYLAECRRLGHHGAFDSLGHPRKGLLLVHADAIDAVMSTKKAASIGQFDLFGSMDGSGGTDDPALGSVFDVKVPTEAWDARHLLAVEREMLRLYVTVGGILAAVNRRVNKNGEPWASAQSEDLAGGIEVLVFPRCYQEIGVDVAEDAIVLVKARANRRDDRVSPIVNDIAVPDLTQGNGPGGAPVKVSLRTELCTPQRMSKLKDVLSNHPGPSEVHLALVNGTRTTVLRLDDALKVTRSSALMGDLKALLGPACLG